MPSYHQKKSNPNMIFILGADIDEPDHIIIKIDDNHIDNNINNINNKKFKFLNYIFIFLKNILIF